MKNRLLSTAPNETEDLINNLRAGEYRHSYWGNVKRQCWLAQRNIKLFKIAFILSRYEACIIYFFLTLFNSFAPKAYQILLKCMSIQIHWRQGLHKLSSLILFKSDTWPNYSNEAQNILVAFSLRAQTLEIKSLQIKLNVLRPCEDGTSLKPVV